MARPTLWKQELQEAICELVAQGDRPEVAAGVSGIGRTTHFDWMRADHNGYRTAVERARDIAESGLRATVLGGDSQGIGFGPAKAALEVLSRRWPKQWAQRVKHEIEDAERLMFEALERVCGNPDVLRRVREKEDLGVVFVAVCEELSRLDGEEETASRQDGAGEGLH